MATKNATPPAAAVVREPVTATGVALLALLASAADGSMMLTQAEGQDIIAAGHATVDTSVVENDTAKVTLTEAGKAALQAGDPAGATAATATSSAASSSFDIDDAVAMPTDAARRGRSGGYPFDKLAVGQSFHVAKTAENEDPAARLASSVSGARAKYSEPTGEKEDVVVKTYKRAETGKGFAKDAEGKRIVESEKTETRDVLKVTRDFTVKTVGAEDPRGVGARVWRTA